MLAADFNKIQNITFFAILLLISVAFLWILKEYAMPIFWAAVLAIIFSPLNEYFVRKFKQRRALASALTLFLIIVMIIVPSSFLGALFVKELSSLYEKSISLYASEQINLQFPLKDKISFISDLATLEKDFFESMKKYSDGIGSFALGVGKSSADFVLKFAVMLYILFFFLKDGLKWTKRIMEILPLGRKKENYLLSKFTKMVRAVFKGSFLIAFIQGALGGILFWIVGIPSPVVWATIMMLLAFIPAVGPALVWAPAALILFLTGDFMSASILVIGGVFAVGMADNLLRPYLLSKDTDMPDLLIFISVLGAISVFGVAGLVIGPTLSALFLASWELFEKEFKGELKKWG